ncbi:MAG TPA: hypothetical protein VG146_08645 [Verrucomicrobiae bacterium]|nr:hypothetical protein [Verrucomicrobiae bacterium]
MDSEPLAWQPLTPRCIAAFARASFGRLWLIQFVVSLLAAGVVVWFVKTDWYPVIAEAIGQLPPQGQVRSSRLLWNADSPVSLAENRFLALTVDLNHTGEVRSPAHLQAEFGTSDIKLISLFGFLECPYPRGYVVPFNRTDLGAWWGAWGPILLAITAGAVVLWLFCSWSLLATAYCLPAWLLGFFANRDLTLAGSWRLAGAALMPGALWLIGAILLYGLGWLDLVRLMVAGAIHFVIGWIYLGFATFNAPRHPVATEPAGNPFGKTENPTGH